MLTNKQLFTLIIFLIFITGNFYISGIVSVVHFLISIFIYSFFFYILYGTYKKLKNKEYHFLLVQNYQKFLDIFLYRVSIFIVILFSLIGWFWYYQNELSPAKMPTYTLTNGEKTLIFQWMSHIGTQNFYNQVQELIKTYKTNDFVLYFEWVRPGSEKNHEQLNKALWVKFDQDTYKHMSQLYGLVKQDNSIFLWLVNNKDFNIDISVDDIIGKYQNIKTSAGITERNYENPLDVNELIVSELSQLNDKQLKILQYINKAFINIIIKSNSLQRIIQNNFANKELFEVILNERNKVIAEEIIFSEHTNIITIYGLLHFEWVFELLKQNDIKWRITHIDYLHPLK